MLVNGIERDYIVHDDKCVRGFFGDYRFLSNFEVSPVVFEGVEYPSSEAAYQGAKSLDPVVRSEFVNLSPSKSKKRGQEIECRSDWNDVKYGIMYEIVLDKFFRNPELGQKLLDTGDRYLEETNHWRDKVWGVCNGVGTNWLGKILMDVRAQMR
jgi:ribA/ribD-fused uncharacterized protein